MPPTDPQRPRSSLPRLMADLGSTFLDFVRGSPRDDLALSTSIIYDPADEVAPMRDALVLGVGVHGTESTAAVLERLAEAPAAALVVRGPVTVDHRLAEVIDASGMTLLALNPGASWSQFAAMVRTSLVDTVGGPTSLEATIGGIASGDMFALANAIAALIDAPVTIEDRSSRVLAFSGRQDETDPARVATVLGREVPAEAHQQLKDRGAFHDIYRQDGPVFIEPLDLPSGEFSLPRTAIAVRAGGEILGSIWAAVRAPLSAERLRALAEAAKLTSMHLLQLRAGADVDRRLRADLVSTALEGGAPAADAMLRLGLRNASCVVLAMAMPDDSLDDPDLRARTAAERSRMGDALAVHLSALDHRAAVAELGNTMYGIFPVTFDAEDPAARVAQIARTFLRRTGTRAIVGVGVPAGGPERLPHSRASADRALRVLRARAERSSVLTAGQAHVSALLLELSDLSRTQDLGETGHVARLMAYDQQHDGRFVETLWRWLESFGDVPAAAAASHIHTNTFRYRLRRLSEISGIDLANPDDRFAALLQLRVMQLAGDWPGTRWSA